MAKRKMKTVDLEGKIQWAMSLTVLDKYKKYGCNLYDLSQDDLDIAEEVGLRIHKGDADTGSYVKLSRKELNYEKKPNGPVQVMGEDKRPWDTSIGIGNGSKVKVRLFAIPYQNDEGEDKWTCKLEKVKVLEHVPYELKDSEAEWEIIEEETSEKETSDSPDKGLDEFGDDLPDELQPEVKTSEFD